MTSNIGSQYLLKGSTEGGTIAEQARSLVLGEIQVELHLTEEARLLIAERGFDPIYGARPLRRFISRVVENGGGPGPPARQHRRGGVVTVTAADGELLVDYTAREMEEAGTA